VRRALALQLVAPLVGADPRKPPAGARAMTGGESGRVWRVEHEGRAYAVKLIGPGREAPFERESADARVYSARWSNLRPAYRRLVAIDAPRPRLHATGALEPPGLRYAVLDFVEGDPDDFSPDWFAAAGAALSRLHRERRSWQGWVGMRRPYSETWTSAFARSCLGRLEATRGLLAPALHRALTSLLAADLAALTEPPGFVFSHTDGLQGVFQRAGAGWRLAAVIDIEDHQFTDQRFVLAGFELGHAIAGRETPDAFWRAYQVPLDPSYPRFRRLFQAYYLLVWARVFRGRPRELQDCIGLLESLAA